MRDYYMVFVIIIIFAGGYLASGYLDSFMKKIRKSRMQNERPHYQWIHIGVERVDLLEDIAGCLGKYSDKLPYMQFFIDREDKMQIFRDLKEERLDIALLADEPEERIPEEYQMLKIPHTVIPHAAMKGHVIEPAEIHTNIVLIWNRKVDMESIEHVRTIVTIY